MRSFFVNEKVLKYLTVLNTRCYYITSLPTWNFRQCLTVITSQDHNETSEWLVYTE